MDPKMRELIEFAKNYTPRYSYLPQEVLDDAKDNGLISSYEKIESKMTNDRRWGYDQETVFKVNQSYILFAVYVMISDGGGDELNYVYEVEPSYEVNQVWKRVLDEIPAVQTLLSVENEDDEPFIPLTLEEFKQGITAIPDGHDDMGVSATCSILEDVLDEVEKKNFITKDEVAKLVSDWFEYPKSWRDEYVR